MGNFIIVNDNNKSQRKYLKCACLISSEVEWVNNVEEATIYYESREDMNDLMTSIFYDWPWTGCYIKHLRKRKDGSYK